MAEQELERRYKKWCKDAVKGRVPFDHSNGLPVTVGPLFRNVPTTPLVFRTEQGSVLPMLNLPSIIRDTAQRIDKNAASVAAAGQPPGEQMLALTVKELSVALANLGAHALEKNVTHGLGLHLLPFTIGKWVYKIRLPKETETETAIPTEKRLRGILEKIRQNGRFCHVTIHKSYTGLSQKETARMNDAQKMLQFKDPEAPLMRVLGADLDSINLEKQSDPNVLGSYLCRTSMVQKIEGIARRALQNFGLFAPEAPLDHILATRLYEASRVYGSKSRYLIQRFAGKSEPGPIVREFSGILARAKEIVREHKGMMQITSLLVQLVVKVLRIEDRRDGAKERGMLYNLRHATAVNQSNELMFFLNAIRTDDVENQQTFAPPVLSEFDLRENSSGQSKPSWAKSLLELERLTGHDTIEDTKGSAIVTMVGFPFQCTFVLESQPGEGFFYCPHRFSNRHDAIEHVKAVHKGEDLTEEIIMKIAQVDDQLEDTEFGKSMEIVNEVAKVRQLGLDEKDPEILRRRPTLHADVYEMSRIVTNNTMILERLRRDRDEAAKMLQSLNRSTAEGMATAKRQIQLFGVRNRAITDSQKRMFAPSTLASLQRTWEIAKTRKTYVTGNMYKAFMESKDQLSLLDTTLGAESRQYDEKVKALGGVDPGAIPAGIPGGGIRVDKPNVGGIVAQDLIERSRYIGAVQDANQALIAANREATINRVVSENDIDFGASNVLPAATPVLAADGWDDENVDESGDQDLDAELEPTTASRTTTVVSKSNPLKRSRPKDDSNKDRGIVALLAGNGVLSINEEAFTVPEKIQVVLPTVRPFLQDVLKVELERVIRMRGLKGAEKTRAMERDMHTLNMAFHPRMREEAASMSPKNALSPGEIRTMMDPFRGRVSVLVLTDPRLIRYPNGVLMRRLSGCVTLSDNARREFPDDEERLCFVLATGICKLLQPKFQLSVVGLDLVVRALKCVLLERIGEGRDGHWEVVSSLVEALNGNLQGFWNAAYLRRYHDIQDPSHKTRHVDSFPEKTYAPVDRLPSLDAVIARIKKPIVAMTSPLSVSPSESSAAYPELRVEEVRNLARQVTSALSEHKADLVKIVDSEGLDDKSWIDRLVKGNVNASDNPHAMCTWFRNTKVTASECRDEEKHQWLREAYCCICSELLASAPFEGWCCLSGAPSLDAVLDNALRDLTDPIAYSARRDWLRQSLVNTVISQPHYPSFHLWHRHCKKADDCRSIVESQARAGKTRGEVTNPRFDECPMCRTKYPKENADVPSMRKIVQKLEDYAKLVKNLVKPAALQDSSRNSNPEPSLADQGDISIQEPVQEKTNSDDVIVLDDDTDDTDTEPLHAEVARTGVAYLGALFQKDTGCANSPALLIPPSPAVPLPEPELTLYEEMIESTDDPDGVATELERAVESIRPSNAVVTSGTQNPMNITTVNNLMDEIGPLHDVATEIGNMMANDTAINLEVEALIQSLVDLGDNQLLENIEASALDREAVNDETITHVVEAPALEPVAAENQRRTFGAKVMGGSGACQQRGCKACPYLMPRTNKIGTRHLKVPIDCQSRNVVYASICHTCQILHGTGVAAESFREEIRLLDGMSANRRTLLSRCALGHVPTLVGLDTYTTEEEAKEKAKAWEDEFKQMKTLDLQAI